MAQYAAPIFPVLSPLPVEHTAAALAFFAFARSFAQTWGITIASTILQNELKKKLPDDFVSQFPQGLEIAYAAIPLINGLPEPLRFEVRRAFADSLKAIWQPMIGISGAGLLTVLMLREIPMPKVTDEKYGLHPGAESAEDEEKAVPDVGVTSVHAQPPAQGAA